MSATLHKEARRHQIQPGRERYVTQTDHMMMVVWEFSNGPAEIPDPPHSHPHEQITYVAEGRVRFFIGETSYELSVGDMIAVPGNVPHTVQLLTPYARLVDSFTPVRDEFLNS